jgi:hypothetical protein
MHSVDFDHVKCLNEEVSYRQEYYMMSGGGGCISTDICRKEANLQKEECNIEINRREMRHEVLNWLLIESFCEDDNENLDCDAYIITSRAIIEFASRTESLGLRLF